jgi:hypothetical protein
MLLVKMFCAICCLSWLYCYQIAYACLIYDFGHIQRFLDHNVSSIFIIYESSTVCDLEQLQIQEFVSKAGQDNLLAKTFTVRQK